MAKKSAKVAKKGAAKPVLLTGGNPQIAKAHGDVPVQAYIAAARWWSRSRGRSSATGCSQSRARAPFSLPSGRRFHRGGRP